MEVERNVPGWEDEEEEEEVEEQPKRKRKPARKGAATVAAEDEFGDWEDPVEGLQEMLTTGADTVQIWRCPRTGPREFVDTFTAETFSLVELREKYGPGRYLVRVRRNMKWIKGGNVITLAARADDMAKWTPGAALVSARPTVGGEDASITATLLRLLLEQRQQPQQGGGFQSVMKEMVEGAAAQTTALLTMFSELQRKSGSGGGIAESLDGLRALMEFRDEIGGGSGGGASGPWDLLKPMVPGLVRALEQHGKGGEVATQSEGGSEVAARAQVAPPKEEAPKRPPSPLDALGPYMGHVIGWARDGSNPEAWAAVVEAQSSEAAELIGRLYDALGHDGFFMELERIYPDVAPHRTWAERFVASLVDDGGGEDDEPEPGAE